MHARDFWRSGRWHKLTTGDPGSPFYFTQQPYVSEVSETYVTVRFGANTECQAYMEWATSAAALGGATDSTNYPGESSFNYRDHAQSATGLSRVTTYHLRVIVTDAQGNTLTSNVISFTTAGTQPEPTTGTGPRYDLYGAGASGSFPTLGTVFGGTAVPWTDSNVYIVPDSVWNNTTNKALALTNWVRDTVPDGASSATPSYIVFDRSHGGTASTQYGAGTQYDLTRNMWFNYPQSTVRRNLVFWGYNSKVKLHTGIRQDWTQGPPGIFAFYGGGFENVYVLGFDIDGPGHNLGEAPQYVTDIVNNGASEMDKGVDITSFSGFKMMDCYIHHTADFVRCGAEWSLESIHYKGWSHGPYSNDAEVAYNEGYYSMNQGLLVGQGWNLNFHHNHIHDVRQKTFDIEDNNWNPVGSPARKIVNLTISNNRFGRWAWQSPSNPIGGVAGISFEDQLAQLDAYGPVAIENNEFYDGIMGSGNPDAHAAMNLPPLDISTYILSRHIAQMALPFGWKLGAPYPNTESLTIRGNVSYLPQWMLDQNQVYREGGGVANVTGACIVTDNNFQGMEWWFRNCPNLEWARNDATYVLV